MNVAKYTRVPWACLVFVGCLAYFLLSGAWVPYPGASADFLAAICFPGQLEGFFFSLFAIGISAAETAVAIAIIINIYRNIRNIQVKNLDKMKW